MRRPFLVLIILMSIIQMGSASVEIPSTDEFGKAVANLLLEMSDFKKENFGLSSGPVDISNPPVPINAVELDGKLSSNPQTLVGEKRVYAYWDIASINKVRISVSIVGSMEGPAGTDGTTHTLDWCCYYDDSNGKRHYVGYKGENGAVLVPYQNSQADDFQAYGSSYVIYDESGAGALSFSRRSSVALYFQTADAYPSDSIPAGVYTGTLVLSLEVV